MSDKGYLKAKQEKMLAKLGDGVLDFNVIMGEKRVLFGIFKVGNFLERNDRKSFEFIISYLDDNVIGDNPSVEAMEAIDQLFDLIETKDFKAFSLYTSNLLSGVIKTPFGPIQNQIFLGAMLMVEGVVQNFLLKIEATLKKAEEEEQ